MTLLMWNHEPDGFVILTDTLNVRSDTAELMCFNTKVYPVLERDLVAVGTGSAALIERWTRWLRYQPPCEPAMLDAITPIKLSVLWAEICAEFPPTGTASTATVYHFTLHDGMPVVYTYRSVDEFGSERDAVPGQSVKPFLGQRGEHTPAAALTPAFVHFDDVPGMVELACRIRADQDTRPVEERVHVGGELYLTTFAPGIYTHQRVHIFEDRDEMATRMLLGRGIDIADGIHIDVEPDAETARSGLADRVRSGW
jgi:hypothetical protein